MEQRRVKRGDRRLLPAMLARRRREHAADLADQAALYPKTARLVEKVAHLGGHVAEPGRRAENDRLLARLLVGRVDGEVWLGLVNVLLAQAANHQAFPASSGAGGKKISHFLGRQDVTLRIMD